MKTGDGGPGRVTTGREAAENRVCLLGGGGGGVTWWGRTILKLHSDLCGTAFLRPSGKMSARRSSCGQAPPRPGCLLKTQGKAQEPDRENLPRAQNPDQHRPASSVPADPQLPLSKWKIWGGSVDLLRAKTCKGSGISSWQQGRACESKYRPLSLGSHAASRSLPFTRGFIAPLLFMPF